MTQNLIITASNGHNLTLAQQVLDQAKAISLDSEIINLVDLKLPLYSPKAQESHIPEAIPSLVDKVKNAKSFIVISPEYNGSTPPSLSNFIAWLSVSTDDFRACFNGKVGAVMSFSGTGTHILTVMRLQLSYLGVTVVGRQLLANYAKPAKDESILDILNTVSDLI